MAITIDNVIRRYKDLSFTFNIHPIKGSLVLKEDAEAIKQSLKNLLFTRPGERLFHPEIGCGIYSLLFEPATVAIKTLMEETIRETIDRYEPRISVRNIQVTFPTPNALSINIVFVLVNTTAPITINILVDRVI